MAREGVYFVINSAHASMNPLSDTISSPSPSCTDALIAQLIWTSEAKCLVDIVKVSNITSCMIRRLLERCHERHEADTRGKNKTAERTQQHTLPIRVKMICVDDLIFAPCNQFFFFREVTHSPQHFCSDSIAIVLLLILCQVRGDPTVNCELVKVLVSGWFWFWFVCVFE